MKYQIKTLVDYYSCQGKNYNAVNAVDNAKDYIICTNHAIQELKIQEELHF